MKWVDRAGYAAAVGWSGTCSAAVAVRGIRFVAPIRTSDLAAVPALTPVSDDDRDATGGVRPAGHGTEQGIEQTVERYRLAGEA